MAKDKINTAPCALLVIGGSAGSLDVLLRILPFITTPLNFAVLIVLHRKKAIGSDLADLLALRIRFPVKEIGDKEQIHPGTFYVAPPDYHVLIEKTHLFSLDYSEKINYSRPSIDVTFESAAMVYGSELACLLLSGANADGAEGLRIAKNHGARIAVQDPKTADSPQMPEQGLLRSQPDTILKPEEMADFILSL